MTKRTQTNPSKASAKPHWPSGNAGMPHFAPSRRRRNEPNDAIARTEPLTILYRDAELVAVMKPPGLATIPGRGETTSVREVLAAQPGLPSSGQADPRGRV